MTHPKKTAVAALLLAGVTILAYLPALKGGFVTVDDAAYVTENLWVKNGITGRGILWAFTSLGYAWNWHPLTWLSHMLDVSLFGLNPAGHHAVSLAGHTANAVLLLMLLVALTGNRPLSMAAAAFFAWHPIQVESAAWIAERKNILSTFLFLVMALLYLRYARRPSLGRYAAVFSALALGLMAKPMLVTAPFLLLLLDYWPLGRIKPPAVKPLKSFPFCILTEKTPLLALGAVSAAVTFLAQAKGGAMPSKVFYSAGAGWSHAPVAYWNYLAKFVWPNGLAVYYPLPGGVETWLFWVPAAMGLIAVTFLLAAKAASRPWLIVGWTWFLGSLVPVIGIVQVGEQAMADRYAYLPFIGLFVAVSWSVGKITVWRRWKAIVLAMVLMALAALSWRQAGYWQNTLTLMGHTLAVTENNWFAHNHYGLGLMEQRRYSEAVSHFQEAVRIRHGFAGSYVNLGNALLETGRIEEAIKALSFSLTLDEANAEPWYGLGLAYSRLGALDSAEASLRRAALLRPDYLEAYNNLAGVLLARGKREEAEAMLRRALDLDPDYAKALVNLALILEGKGDLPQAASYYRAALAADPGNTDIGSRLERVLAVMSGRPSPE